MKRRAAVIVAGLVTIVLAVAGVACSDDDKGSGGSGDASLLALLRFVPDTAANRAAPLSYSNFDRVRSGTTSSSGDADLHLLSQRSAESLFLGADLTSGLFRPEFNDYAGFDTRNLSAVLAYGTLPDTVTVYVGRFDADRVTQGLRQSPGGEDVRTSTSGGMQLVGVGTDGQVEPENRSAIRMIGQNLELAVNESILVWAHSSSTLGGCLAARSGGTSLADDAGFASLAEALDRAKVTTAELMTPTTGERWKVAGLGEVRHGDSSVFTVAIVYPDAASASAAVAEFRSHVEQDTSLGGTRWSDMVTISDVKATGVVLVATLKTPSAGLTHIIAETRDNLLQFG